MKAGIDPEVLRRIIGDDPEMAREVVEDFVPAAQSAVIEIRAAVNDVDPDQVKNASHKLKGSASVVGAHRLVEICAELETAGENCDWPTIHRLSAELHGLMGDIETSAAAFLASMED